MHHNSFKPLLCALLLALALPLSAQKLKVIQSNGGATTIPVTSLSEITFNQVNNEDDGHYLVKFVSEADTTTLSFKQNPKLNFSKGKMTVTYDGTQSAEWPLADIREIVFAYSPHIGANTVVGDGVRYSFDGDLLSIAGLPEGSLIALYSIDGRKLLELRAGAVTTVDMAPFKGAPVVVATVAGSFKFTR